MNKINDEGKQLIKEKYHSPKILEYSTILKMIMR